MDGSALKLPGAVEFDPAGEYLEARPDLDRKPNLVWVASYPKSGNTWMRLFLDAFLTKGGEVRINDPRGHGEGDMRPDFYEAVAPCPMEELSAYESMWLRPAAIYAQSRRAGDAGGDVLVKTHCAFGRCLGVDLIPRELSKGAVYVVRDPRDVAISYAAHMSRSIDEAIQMMGQPGAFIWRDGIYQFVGRWCDNVRSWTTLPGKPPRAFPVIVCRYEDMVAQPLEIFRNVARVMRADADPALVERCVFGTSFTNLQAQEAAEGFYERHDGSTGPFFRKGRPGDWVRVLTKEQRARIEQDHGPEMERWGYL